MVKFLTDGMLINEMMGDPLLTDYSIIIVDDIHERSLNTDLLLGLLKKFINILKNKKKKIRFKTSCLFCYYKCIIDFRFF